jgi:antitoxin (DNA-binding transcriptional repressor) of toxin-antitoxin stability system
MRETTFTELKNRTKSCFDAAEEGATVRVDQNGRPMADMVPVKDTTPAWKNPPQIRLSLGDLRLADEILADRHNKS